MSTITLQNFRVGSDLTVKVRLKDGGVAIDWSTLSGIRAVLYSDAQSSIAGRCDVTVDGEDPTLLVCRYAATKMQYLGVNRIVVSAKYMGMTKTYDKPAFTFVRWTEDQAGEEITIEDPEVTVEIDVEDVSSSILQEAVDAAFSAADRANEAAAAAEHMVDIHTGPEGKSAYEVAVEEGYTGTEEEWLASLKGDTGETPDISIGTVTTVEPGTPAAASMTGTPEAPVLNLSIPQGVVGATPNFTVGTVTTGEPGSSVIVTITGTPEAPVLNVTIPQGMQGNTGSSVDYPYELVNNLTTNDATKGLSAAQGVVLDGKVSQLEAEVTDLQDELVLDVSGDVNLGKWEVGSIGYYGGAIINSSSNSRVRMAQKTIEKEGDYKLTCASGFEFAILIVGKVTTVTWVTSFERHLVVGDVYRIAMRQSPLGDYTGYTQAQIDTLVASSQISFNTYGLATKPEVEAKLDKETFDLKFSYPQNLSATIQGFVGNNGLIYNNSGYWRTDYISLHGYDRIFARAIIYNNGCDIAFFDANKTFLSAISVVGNGGTHTYEIDLSNVAYKDARYVIISTVNQSWNMLKLFSYDSLSNDMMLMPANNHINMLVFGDSITHAANIILDEDNCTSTYAWDTGATAKPWVQIVRDYLQAYDVRDYAKHGATYVDLGAELLSVSFQIQVAINDLSNPNNVFPTQGTFVPDIVIFALGTNDGAPTDTYEEAMAKTIFDQSGDVDIEATLANLDRTKLYQALRYAYLRAKYTWPYAMMMVVLPIQRAGNPNNFVVGTLHDAIKRMANRHSIKVIDGAFDMGVCTDLEKISAEGALLFDGLHPNAKGKNVYARMMLNAIKSNYVNLSNMNPIS